MEKYLSKGEKILIKFLGGFDVELCEFSVYFCILTLIRYIVCKYLPPLSRIHFHFVDNFLCCAKVLLFDVVSFVYFCFWFPPKGTNPKFGGDKSKNTVRLMSRSILPMFSSRSYIVSDLTFKSLINLTLSFIRCEKVIQFDSYAYSCPGFPAPFLASYVIG